MLAVYSVYLVYTALCGAGPQQDWAAQWLLGPTRGVCSRATWQPEWCSMFLLRRNNMQPEIVWWINSVAVCFQLGIFSNLLPITNRKVSWPDRPTSQTLLCCPSSLLTTISSHRCCSWYMYNTFTHLNTKEKYFKKIDAYVPVFTVYYTVHTLRCMTAGVSICENGWGCPELTQKSHAILLD